MDKEKTAYTAEEIKVQAAAFEDFIISCLRIDNPSVTYFVGNQIINFSPTIDKNGGKYRHICIKYANTLSNLIKTIAENSNKIYDITLIGLWSQKNIQSIKDLPSNITIFGFDYVKNLTKKHKTLWWSFAGAFDNKAKIELSADGKKAMLKTKVLGFGSTNVYIDLDKIDDISSANEHEFLRLIKDGEKEPALIIGNGVSIPFGSDSWSDLSTNIFDYLHPFYINNVQSVKEAIGNSNYAITSMVKDTLNEKTFLSSLWYCIYRKYNQELMHIDSTLLRAITTSKYRHQKMPIITYNYDSFLENDFKVCYPSFNIKSVDNKEMNNKTKEPKIIHVHGMIRFEDKNNVASNIILTDNDYLSAYKPASWPYQIQKKMLEEKVCLFVGSSMSDVYQMSLIHEVRKNDIENSKETQGMWKCFALLCFKDLENKDKLSIINYYLRKGVYVIFVDNFSKLPQKLKRLMAF